MTLKMALCSAFGCFAIVSTLADVGLQKAATKGSDERRLIIRAGTLFTKEGVPIQLSGFDSEIESDQSPEAGGRPAKHIKAVIVRSGSALVRVQDLSKLLERRVNNPKLTDLTIETSGSEVKISGHLKKTLPVHFEIKGPVSVTKDGLIDLHESSMKVDKVPVKGLAGLLGMDPGRIVGNDPAKGIQANKEDILLDPNELWGMSVQGKLTQVKVIKNSLVLVYGSARTPSLARAAR